MLNDDSGFDPKQKVIQELIEYLRKKDDDDLGGVVKPKGMDAMSMEGKDDDADDSMGMGESGAPQAKGLSDGDGDESKGDGMSGMSEEDLNDLIEALSGKVG